MRSFQFMITFFLPLCITFEIKCPCPSERDLRAIAFCNKSSTLTYSCLYDENRGLNLESCKMNADFAPPGNKYVLRGQPDFTPCSTDRYQPIRLWFNASNQCIFKKSQCIGNGQFLYKYGTTELDRFCRCDYTRGYDFIAKPRNACFCIPSEEECSCYKKYCPHNGVLTPDYNCATEKDIPGKNSYNCPIIVHDRLSTGSLTIKENNLFLKELLAEYSSRFIVFVVTAICTFLITVEGVLVTVLICYRGEGNVMKSTNEDEDEDEHTGFGEESKLSKDIAITTNGADCGSETTAQGTQRQQGAGVLGPSTPGDEDIQFTPKDKEAIDNLKALGFSKGKCIESYVVCEKNEEKAANLMFQYIDDDEE